MRLSPLARYHGRLITLALAELEDARARAWHGDFERTRGQRLALTVLVDAGVAEQWQARACWDLLAYEGVPGEYETDARYTVYTRLTGLLRDWRHRAMLPDHDLLDERGLLRRYALDLDLQSGTAQHPCMCNRYEQLELDLVIVDYDAEPVRPMNGGPPIVHPRDTGTVVRIEGGRRVVDAMSWGFPVYVRGRTGTRGQQLKPRPVNNARFDKLGGFWKRWAVNPANRCLMPVRRFAEAAGQPGMMTTTWIAHRDHRSMAWAAIWTNDPEWGPVYSGVTTANAPELRDIHDRCPLLLDPDDWTAWLTLPFDQLARFDRAYPADRLVIDRTSDLWSAKSRAPSSHGPGTAPPSTGE